MTDFSAEVEAMGREIFGDFCDATRLIDLDGAFDQDLWSTLDAAELTRIGVPESVGGPGGSIREAAALVRLAGEYAAAVPLADALIAGWLLGASGIDHSGGFATIAVGPVTATVAGDAWDLDGELYRVPYGRDADTIVGIAYSPAGPVVYKVDRSELAVRHGVNAAREPRDDIHLHQTVLTVKPMPPGVDDQLLARARLLRAVMCAGAAKAALDLTISHVTTREQFGRPLAAFQSVQHALALAAGELAAADAATTRALDLAAASEAQIDDVLSRRAYLSATIAKARSGRAAGVVAETAHQLHGAIGFTWEHSLRLTTTRLMSWRDEWATELKCSEEVALAAAEVPDGALWAMLEEL